MNLFQWGDFTLNSKAASKWKIECDALTDDDIDCLAKMIHAMVGPFSAVSGVPNGGLRLEAALKPFASLGKHLIVDDVLTTGGSIQKHRYHLAKENGDNLNCLHLAYMGAVIFARGQHEHWIQPLFKMPECFWPEPRKR